MEKNSETWTVEDLRRRFTQINFPEYQRDPNIWSRDAKQRLIDSMVRRFDIASLYFYKNDDKSMDCVDGRQRIGAIMSFFGENPKDPDNKFEFKILNEVFEDKKHPFTQMHDRSFDEIVSRSSSCDVAKKFVDKIMKYALTIIELSSSTIDNEFNLQFARLNLGTIINSGEKLHAMVGDFRNTCFDDLGQHEFLAATKIPTRRFSKEQLAAQILAQIFSLEMSGEYARTRHFDLQRLFKTHATLKPQEQTWIKKTKDVMDLLRPAFGEQAALRNRAIVVSTVLLAYKRSISSKKDAPQIAEFVDEFMCCLNWQLRKGLDVDEQYRYLIDFQRHVTQASVEKAAVEARAKTLTEGLELWSSRGEVRGDKEYQKANPNKNPKQERRQ